MCNRGKEYKRKPWYDKVCIESTRIVAKSYKDTRKSNNLAEKYVTFKEQKQNYKCLVKAKKSEYLTVVKETIKTFGKQLRATAPNLLQYQYNDPPI